MAFAYPFLSKFSSPLQPRHLGIRILHTSKFHTWHGMTKLGTLQGNCQGKWNEKTIVDQTCGGLYWTCHWSQLLFISKDVGRDIDIPARLTFFLMILVGCCEVHVIVAKVVFLELCHLLAWVRKECMQQILMTKNWCAFAKPS